MSDGVVSAKLEPVTGGVGLDLLEIAGDVIGKHHESLVGAEIRWFWALDRPLSFWGKATVVTEETWWLSGDKIGDRVDISMQVNLALWKKLTNAGRKGLLDVILSWVKKKEGGNLQMDTMDGTRLLYEGAKFSLGVSAEVLARNPSFVEEVDELANLRQAVTDPAQFLLDLQAKQEENENEEGGDGDETTLTPEMGEEPEPFHFYKQFEFEDVGRATLRFTEADHRPSSLDGVYIGDEDGSGRAALEYKTDHGTILSFRERLDEYLNDKMIGEIKAGTVDPQEWILHDRPEDQAGEGEESPEHAEVLPMRGRRAGSRV